MNNADLLAKITAAFEAGQSVTVATAHRVTTFTPAIAKKFAAAGVAPFKLTNDGNLAVARGRNYDRISCASGLMARVVIG